MSRRRRTTPAHHGLTSFKLTCTDRGGHRTIEVGLFQDMRHARTDEQLLEWFGPSEGESPLKSFAPENERLTIHAPTFLLRDAHYENNSGVAVTRSNVFVTTPSGERKARLRCPRCGRDEQFNQGRLERLADVVRTHKKAVTSLDISRLSAYLDE